MSSKVKFHINILFLLILVIAGFIWKENPYHVFSPTWTVHALIPLFIWFLIIAAFLVCLVIKLRSTKAFISDSLDQAQEIVTIFDVEKKRFVYVNKAIKDVLGYTAEEVLKDDILPGILFNDQKQPFDNTNNIGSLSAARPLKKKDGSPIYLEYTTIPIHNKSHLDKIIIISRDAGKRIMMEQASSTSQKLYHNMVENSYTKEIESNLVNKTGKIIADKWTHYQTCILENIQESIIALDTKGKVVFLNRQAHELINSKASSPCCGNNIQNILAMREADFKQMLDDVLAGKSWQGETILYIDNIGRHFMHRIDSLRDNGSVSGAFIISTDITELVKNREQAQAADMAKNQFLANMSHEIRTPLIGILGAVDLLHDSKLDNIQNENVEIIRKCGEQLLNIINDILDMSKIELSLMELHPRVCNPVNIFNRMVNNIEPLLKNKGLQIKLDISTDIPALIRVDEAKLRQILSNLFYNAIKFTNRGYVSFSAAVEEEDDIFYLSTIISDTGIGIPEHEFKNIFNPFTQVDNSTSRRYGGTGLGLYISKRYVDLMKGTIHLTSEEGIGATFSVKIPVEIISQTETANVSGLYSENRFEDKLVLGFTTLKILLVEDNDLNQRIVSQMLINYGFEVTLANNGLDCLKLLQERHFDIILMDMQMPIMDGYEATRMIRQYEKLRNIPIIAMTAHAMTGDREKCLASGCTSYIAKPFKSEELAREIRQHFNTGMTTSHNHDPELNNFINELLPEFMAQLADMVDNLGSAFENLDLPAIKSISHDIKGTAGMYGFKEISSSAALIEKAAQEASFPNIKHALEQLYQLYAKANQQVS